MSYQSNPTMVQPVVAPPPPPQDAPGRGGLWLGWALVVIGLIAGIGLYIGQKMTYEQRVENLERAVSGYETTLNFERTGTFTLYYEYAGSFEAKLDGTATLVILDAPASPPGFDARVVDANGDDVRLRRGGPDVSYDVGGFSGVSFRQIVVDETGTYALQIVPDDPAGPVFALSVGRGTVEEPTAVLPAAIVGLGLGLGLSIVLLTVSRRRRARRASPAPASSGEAGFTPFSVAAPAAGQPFTPPPFDVPIAPPTPVSDVSVWAIAAPSAPPPPPPAATDPIVAAAPPATTPDVPLPTTELPTTQPTTELPTPPPPPTPLPTTQLPVFAAPGTDEVADAPRLPPPPLPASAPPPSAWPAPPTSSPSAPPVPVADAPSEGGTEPAADDRAAGWGAPPPPDR
jgi:hypothetical protein